LVTLSFHPVNTYRVPETSISDVIVLSRLITVETVEVVLLGKVAGNDVSGVPAIDPRLYVTLYDIAVHLAYKVIFTLVEYGVVTSVFPLRASVQPAKV
jgi:hypothetical protein